MFQDGIAVHMRSEEYKIGWVHGFYDCVSDDGAFYGGSNHFGCASSNGDPPDATRLYNDGYLDGMTARIGGDLIRLRYLLTRSPRFCLAKASSLLRVFPEVQINPMAIRQCIFETTGEFAAVVHGD